jgi:hypothetical protein
VATLSATQYNAWMAGNAQWMVWLVYLPCTAMVLVRPNEGLAFPELRKVDFRRLTAPSLYFRR